MMAMGSNGSTRRRAKRSLGQNFLVNPGVRDKILGALTARADDWVVEVGSGTGMLTSPLTGRFARVVAVELDQQLATELPGRVARPEVLEVHIQDGARVDYRDLAERAGRPVHVVGNLPFGAASAILRHALDQEEAIQQLILMFQREVARRLTATPATSAYGLLSVVSQQRAEIQRLFDVAPGSFRPRPRVWASVLQLRPRRPPGLPACCLASHDQLVRAAFSTRRKTLQNSLKTAPWSGAVLQDALSQVGVAPGDRAQQVTVVQYAELARFLCHRTGRCDDA